MNPKTRHPFVLAFAAAALLQIGSTGAVANGPAEDQADTDRSKDAATSRKNARPEHRRIRTPDFSLIRGWYQRNPDEFEKLASALEADSEVTELYCDANLVAVTTPDETFYDGEDDPYTSRYMQLCRFTSKVTARRSANGIRFPFNMFEAGPLLVSSFLERRTSAADAYEDCRYNSFKEERGACAVPINEHWSATYAWSPFCLEGMEGEAGC